MCPQRWNGSHRLEAVRSNELTLSSGELDQIQQSMGPVHEENSKWRKSQSIWLRQVLCAKVENWMFRGSPEPIV
jgi:phosphatidate phosphatase APP1